VNKDKPILLVGLGAIGSVIYKRLALKNYTTVCLTSVKSSKLIRRKGLRVKLSTEESLKLQDCEVYGELTEKQIFDRCIIAAKTWVNEFLADDLVKHLKSSASILFLQNGLNIEDPFLKFDNNWRIFRGLTSLAAYRKHNNEAFEASVGETKIGPINNNDIDLLTEWKEILTDIGLNVVLSDNIRKDIWLKTMVNCTIGPLSAITELKNGEILKDAFLSRIVDSIIQEMLSVVPKDLGITYEDSIQLIRKITEETARHKSSMLQDIEAERRTEIDVLNSEITRLAKSKGVKAPINTKIVDLIRKLSNKNIPKEQIILELRSL